MELEEYLQGLRNCPDEPITPDGKNLFTNHLTAEFGIYDNWDILLRADYDEVVRDLIDSTSGRSLFKGQYRLVRDNIQSDNSYINKLFEYVPGHVVMQVGNIVPPGGIIEGDENLPWIQHSNRQQREFSMSLCLCPYQKKDIQGMGCNKAMAIVIEDIAQYAIKKKLPLCFPCSIGRAYGDDYTRIIYWSPPGSEKQEA